MQEDSRYGLTGRIIGAAIEVHRILGRGLLESVYEEALACELRLRTLTFETQCCVDVVYKGTILKGQRIDMVVEDQVVVEIKSAIAPQPHWESQMLTYLRVTGLTRGLLINFGKPKLTDGLKRYAR